MVNCCLMQCPTLCQCKVNHNLIYIKAIFNESTHVKCQKSMLRLWYNTTYKCSFSLYIYILCMYYLHCVIIFNFNLKQHFLLIKQQANRTKCTVMFLLLFSARSTHRSLHKLKNKLLIEIKYIMRYISQIYLVSFTSLRKNDGYIFLSHKIVTRSQYKLFRKPVIYIKFQKVVHPIRDAIAIFHDQQSVCNRLGSVSAEQLGFFLNKITRTSCSCDILIARNRLKELLSWGAYITHTLK